ncbi:MAG: monovalent cation:proton antiporter-2 (CPA2) family protein [Bdellovibrionales bacterium]|nr:monovalent cation:proton antiporter-2 (CPA2) family protein [Bdellovibrionales bacterium]
MHNYLGDFLVFLGAAVVTVPIFRFFKMGAILAYLFAGILIGPQALQLIQDPKVILNFSELGVVLLLFIIGLELKPNRLWKMRKNVFVLGSLQVLTTAFFIFLVAKYFGLSANASFIVGFGLALSSTAFSLQLLNENHQLRTLHGQGSFSILLFQDLAIVPLLAAVPFLSGQTVNGPSIWDLIIVLLGILLLVYGGRYIVRWVLRWVAESRVQEVFTAASLLVVVGTAILAEKAGLSMGMGAFIAGMLLANSEYRHELEINLAPFKGLLMGLFFIAVGMSLDLVHFIERPHLLLISVFAYMFLKSVVVFILGRLLSFPYESSRNMAMTLPQGGEFAFMLFTVATASQLLSDDVSSFLNTIVTVSMVLSPFVFTINQKFMRTYSEVSERPHDVIGVETTEVIIAGYGRFGQIVSRFLKTEGIKFTILEHSAVQVDTARKYGTKIYYGNASRADIVEAAGGREAKIFVLAIDNVETSITTAKMVKTKFPNMEIIARARNRQHAIELMKLGINNVHRETYLTSLEVAKEVLLVKGAPRDRINRHLAKFRKHDEEILRKQMDWIGDEQAMISKTNKANQELEDILISDRKEAVNKKTTKKI